MLLVDSISPSFTNNVLIMPNWLLSMNFQIKPATSGAIINGDKIKVRKKRNPRYLCVKTTAKVKPMTVSKPTANNT
ncbi:hypothetical protein D3C77_642680 [compost metagenome]